MPINAYADERGDTGYQFDSGSSPRFVFVIVIPVFPEALLDQLTAARRALHKNETYEFHYRQSTHAIRQTFFEAIASTELHIWVANIHKRRAPLALQTQGKAGLYAHALSGLALRAPHPLDHTRLHLDESGKHKHFLQTLKNAVRLHCRANRRPQQNFSDIRGLDSTHPLIQCADMLAGAADSRPSTPEWWDLLTHKHVVWWDEPFA